MIPRAIGSSGNPNLPPKGSKPWKYHGGNILKSGSSRNQTFKEFLALLIDEKVEFALVGGYAVAYHGYPRYTGDIDILIRPSPDNSAKVITVLKRFGFGSLSITEADLQAEAGVLQLGYPPQRIDLITSLDGVTNRPVGHRTCWIWKTSSSPEARHTADALEAAGCRLCRGPGRPIPFRTSSCPGGLTGRTAAPLSGRTAAPG